MVRKNSLYIFIVLAIVLLIALGYLYYSTTQVTPSLAAEPEVATTSASAAAAATIDIPASVNSIAESQKSGVHVDADVISQTDPTPPEGYVEYRNKKYGFSYYHSPQAKITEYDEGSGAMTLVHENFEKVRGFQVFIVPYAEPLITEERFRQDVPSGVRKNVEDATLDGVRAVTFNSVDPTLGETREIWVIRNGYLYEITTFSGVGQWFTPIIQSWRWR